jgi:hypothetical protein
VALPWCCWNRANGYKYNAVADLTLKQAKQASLILHSVLVRFWGSSCQAVGVLPYECAGPLQCAHIVPKRANTASAVDPLNGWALCAGHHLQVDSNPARWLAMVDHTGVSTLVHDWMNQVDDANENGLLVDGDRVTPLRWWRRQAAVLWWRCVSEGAGHGRCPKYVATHVGEKPSPMLEYPDDE